MNLTPEQATWLRAHLSNHVATFRGGIWMDETEKQREHMRFCLAEAANAQAVIDALDEAEACRL